MNDALGHAQPSQTTAVAWAQVDCHQQGFGFFTQQLGVGQSTRGDHPNHFALHRPFAAHFTDLLTNSNRLSLANQLGQVAFHRVKGNACHGNRHAGTLAALGQGDIEEPGGFFGVFIEHFIEVTHPIKQQGIGVVRLQAQVLGHHGGVLLCVFGHWGEVYQLHANEMDICEK